MSLSDRMQTYWNDGKKDRKFKPDDESDMMKVTKNITGKQKKILRTPMGKSNKWPSNVYF